MYNNIKTRHQRSVGGRSSSRRGGGSKRSGGVSPHLYINKSEDLPEQVAYVPTHSFRDFSLNAEIVERVVRKGYEHPTPIQDQAIPVAMGGRDVIGVADTGSGKTAAFLLPLLHKTLRDRDQRALIVAPTRELAVQIDEEFRAFSAGLGLYSALCIGGSGMHNQMRALERRPQFIIGTPGRLKDHLTRRTLRLDNVTNLVLDEADRMVDMGFINDVRFLLSYMPKERQSFFFSATIGPEVKGLIHSFLNNPETIAVKTRETSVNVDQDVVRFTDPFHKISLLHDLLSKPEFQKVLIFGRTKHGVEKLSHVLDERGFRAVSIHGNKNQSQRQRALQDFKAGKAQILVATDVAARGLDIPNVSHVINYDAPEQYADYIHRIGRTGRANQKGSALTFVQ